MHVRSTWRNQKRAFDQLFRSMSVFLACAFVTVQLTAQTLQLSDSLEQQLAHAENDIDRIYWLNRLTWLHLVNQPDQSEAYNKQARKLAESAADTLAIARTHHYDGIRLRILGNNHEAIEQLRVALELYDRYNSQKGTAGVLFNLGVAAGNIGQYGQSIEYFHRAYDVNAALSDTSQMADALNSMASVHRKMGNYSKALERYHEALTLQEIHGELWNITNIVSNIGHLHLEMGQADEAAPFLHRARSNNRKLGDDWGMGFDYHNLGTYYMLTGRPDSALLAFTTSLAYREALELKLETAETLTSLGEVFLELGRASEALSVLNSARTLSEEIGSLETSTNVHRVLARALRSNKRFEEAINHVLIYAALRDSANSIEKSRIIEELEMRFETARKDRQLGLNEVQIAAGKAKIKRQELLLQRVIAASVAALIIAALIIINLRTRKRLASEQLTSLTKTKELDLLKSVIRGEEQERTRIAQELHDGLSAQLAAAHLQFDRLKMNRSPSNNETDYNRALTQLADLSHDLRRIAHNMMPDSVQRHGLIVAIEDFVQQLNTGSTAISFEHYGTEDRLPPTLERSIYRMVQELLTNVVRHSAANGAIVQINRRENNLYIVVEDNGKGFSQAQPSHTQGIGLANLVSRVKYLNGSLNIESTPGIGTSVYIEFDLNHIQNGT